MDNYLNLNDTQSPREGKAFITIGGQNREMFEIQNLKAQLEQNIITKTPLGSRMAKHKRGTVEGTGSCTMYFMNSEMLNATVEYLNSGIHVPITIQGYNLDVQSSIGMQEVLLSNVIFKTIPVISLDDGSDDPITFDSDFTFDKVVPLNSFVKPTNYQ